MLTVRKRQLKFLGEKNKTILENLIFTGKQKKQGQTYLAMNGQTWTQMNNNVSMVTWGSKGT